MSIIYNASLPTKTYVNESVCKNAYTSKNYRLADIEKVYAKEPGLRDLIEEAPIRFEHKKILIDVKIQHLKKEQYTCANKAWHLDGKAKTKPRTKYDNVYHIITWGGAPTLFIKHPFMLDGYDVDQRLYAKSINLNLYPRYELEPYIYHTYGEYHWHRCGQATEDCTRFFLRIIESNYIKERK